MKLRFLSSNLHKIAEVEDILGALGVDVVGVDHKIDEVQTIDVETLVRDKCVKAFRTFGRPLFVEHTGLGLDALNGFPGGLTQIFWDTVKAQRFTQLFGGSDAAVTARTAIGYCDGRQIHYFEGRITGTVPSEPRGDSGFEWDCAFIPDGQTRTFAEMTAVEKNAISMRRKALDAFATFLEAQRGYR